MKNKHIPTTNNAHVTSEVGFASTQVAFIDTDRPIPPAVLRRFIDPSLAYKERYARDTWEMSDYDLEEPVAIEDTESYFRQAIRKKKGLSFKEGFGFTGRDPDTIQYLFDRFSWLEEAQRKSFRILFKETFHELLQKSNAWWFKVRDTKASNGKPRRERGKTIKPVAGYFIAAAETVEFKRDDHGRITKARQVFSDGRRSREFSGEDAVHFTIDKKVGYSVGTPIIEPVKDDIRTLRRIEEHVDLLIYQHLFPLFQYIVGTTDAPAKTYPNGVTEVDTVQQKVEFLPPEGVIVTPERHEIKLIGADGKALKAEGIMKHFKERVFGGMGMSSVDFGEGSTVNRATANTLSGNTIDDVKDIQDDFESQFDQFVIRELLLEGDFDFQPTHMDHMVHLIFNEIDLEGKMAKENHDVQMYTQHAINEDELRQRIGEQPKEIDDEEYREKSYWKLIEEPQLLIKAVDEAYLAADVANPNTSLEEGDVQKGEQMKEKESKRAIQQKKAGPVGRPATKQNSGQRAGAARNRPSNQRGTRSGPKTRDNFVFADTMIHESFKEMLREILLYKESDATDSWIKGIVDIWRDKLSRNFSMLTRDEFIRAASSYGANVYADTEGMRRMTHVRERTEHYIDKLATDLNRRLSKLNGAEDIEMAKTVLEIQQNRLNAIYRTELAKAHNYGLVYGMLAHGYKDCVVISEETECSICAARIGEIVPLDTADLSIIPPFHPNCDCTLIHSTINTTKTTNSNDTSIDSGLIDKITCDVVRLLHAQLKDREETGLTPQIND